MCQNHGVHYPHTQRMLRWRNYKYVFTPTDTDELYDLASDPHETRNLIDEPAVKDAKMALQQRLLQWVERSDDPIASVMGLYFKALYF